MSLYVFIWLFISMVCFGLGEYFSKQLATSLNTKTVIQVLVSYFLATLAWIPAIHRYNVISVVGVIWSVLSILITVILGLIVFKEPVTTFKVVGIILAILSVIFLSL